MNLSDRVRHLIEIVSRVPMLHRKEVAQRYGVDESTIDRWHAAGVLPAPTYLRGSCVPLWKPMDLEKAESKTPKLIRALSRNDSTKRK